MINSFTKLIKGICAVSIISLGAFFNAQAQLGDAGAILRAGTEDANILLENYLAPFGKGFGADLNTGWFNTAKTHKKLGFDISFNVSAAVVPTAGQVLNVNTLGFNQLELISGSPETPTISGESSSNTELGIRFTNPQTGNDEVLTSFEVPGGIGVPYVPAPMAQLSVGLIKDTDVSIRFVPTTELADFGELGLFGVGLKHGINQWLPGGKMMPVDIAVQFGYTSFSSSAAFDVEPIVDSETYNPHTASNWEGQGVELETSASTYNVIVGKTLPIISVYGGIGLENSKTTIATPGAFPITSPASPDDYNSYPNEIYHPVNNPNGDTKIIRSIDSPIDLEIEGDNSFRAFAGARIKLAILQLSASYTLANYSSFNVGFGITFR